MPNTLGRWGDALNDPLLAKGAHWQANACLNYGLDHWYLYAVGYRTAAEILTEHVCTKHTDQDRLIYPVIFLWRHHLELSVKSIGRNSAALLQREWTAPNGHDLSQLFAESRQLFEECFRRFGEKLPNKQTEQLRTAFGKFKSTDMKSVVFRYPEDLDGSKHLEGVSLINFEVVRDYMVELSDALREIEVALDQFEEWER